MSMDSKIRLGSQVEVQKQTQSQSKERETCSGFAGAGNGRLFFSLSVAIAIALDGVDFLPCLELLSLAPSECEVLITVVKHFTHHTAHAFFYLNLGDSY